VKTRTKIIIFIIKFLCVLIFIIWGMRFIPHEIESYIARLLEMKQANSTIEQIIEMLQKPISILTFWGSCICIMIKFVFGKIPKLSEKEMKICLCDVELRNDIPELMCMFFQEEQQRVNKKLEGKMLELYKLELVLDFMCQNTDEISGFLLESIKISVSDNGYRYKYKEIKHDIEKDEIIVRKFPNTWQREGDMEIVCFLYVPRERYANRHRLEHIGRVFGQPCDEIKVEMIVWWINEKGCPIRKIHTKRLKQKKDNNEEIYWES